MAKSLAANALTLLIVLMVALAGLIAWGRNEFVKPGPLSAAICLQVERGASLSSVSARLQEQGAVTNAQIFRVGANYTEKAKDLKFGSYLVPAGASMESVLALITTSGQSSCGQEINFRIGVAAADVVLRELDPSTNAFVEVAKFAPAVDAVPEAYKKAVDEHDMRFRVTLAEGVTSWMVVDALKKADFLSGNIKAVPAEGSLAPDSYDVAKGADRGDLLQRMAFAQERVMDELWAGRAADLPYQTKEEAMTMASIIEKETGVSDERPMVASVFVNRLRKGMRLQTDPTVIYGVTKGEGVLGRGLRRSELQRPTPYNTYTIDGLPPTPIANPGRASIAAALNPGVSDYVYFVADGTGGHAFAKTLDEHNSNVAKWREIERQQGLRN